MMEDTETGGTTKPGSGVSVCVHVRVHAFDLHVEDSTCTKTSKYQPLIFCH